MTMALTEVFHGEFLADDIRLSDDVGMSRLLCARHARTLESTHDMGSTRLDTKQQQRRQNYKLDSK